MEIYQYGEPLDHIHWHYALPSEYSVCVIH